MTSPPEAALRGARERKTRFVAALTLTVALRVIYTGLGVWMAPRLQLDETLIRSNALTETLMSQDDGWRYGLIGVWERFDTLWYLHIAEHGYDRPESVVFFPLYPMLIRLVSPLGGPVIAAVAIATVGAFFVFLGLFDLVARDRDSEEAVRAMILLAVWPASFVLFAGYPESLVIALVIWSIVHARDGKWVRAGVIGFFAGLAKAVGFAVVVPLVVIAWRSRRRRAWAVGAAFLSTPTFLAWQALSGAGSATRAYAAYWRTEIVPPWMTLGGSVRELLNGRFVVDGSLGVDALLLMNVVLLAVVFVPVFVKPLRSEYALYGIAVLVLLLSKKTDPLLQSTDRYVLAVFPAWMGWARWLGRRSLPLVVLPLFFANTFLLLAFFEWALVV